MDYPVISQKKLGKGFSVILNKQDRTVEVLKDGQTYNFFRFDRFPKALDCYTHIRSAQDAAFSNIIKNNYL